MRDYDPDGVEINSELYDTDYDEVGFELEQVSDEDNEMADKLGYYFVNLIVFAYEQVLVESAYDCRYLYFRSY